MRDQQLKWFYRFGILLLFFLTIFVFIKISPLWLPILQAVSVIMFPFFISAFITYLLHPIIEKIHHVGVPRTLAILIIYFLFFGIIGYSLYRGIPLFLLQLKDFTENSPDIFAVYENFMRDIHHKTSALPDGIQKKIENGIIGMEDKLNHIVAKMIAYFQGILSSIFIIMVIPFIVFYMLKDIDKMKKMAWYMTPKKWRKPLESFLSDVDESLGNYIRGQLFVCIVIGALASLSFWLIHLRYPLLLGILIGITNVIPYFGPIIGLLPAAFIALTISIKTTVFVVILVFILQFIEGNILSPLIVGQSLHMHPIIIIFALIAGEELGGIFGLIFAVPILAILKVLFQHLKYHFFHQRDDGFVK